MDPTIAQIVLAILSLATGIVVYLTTRARMEWRRPSRQRRYFKGNGESTYASLLQDAVDKLEQLERENQELRDTREILRQQLSDCIRGRVKLNNPRRPIEPVIPQEEEDGP